MELKMRITFDVRHFDFGILDL